MLIHLFTLFLKIGLLSIGGGYAIIPLIQDQVVTQQHLITQQVFTDIITISQMTPGPLAVNTSTFVGLQLYGIPGAIIATIGCIIGGIIISLSLYAFFKRYRHSTYIFEILKGLKASSLGLIMAAAMTIILLTLFGQSDYKIIHFINDLDIKALLIFMGSLFFIKKYKTGPIKTMLICGIIGLFIYI